MEREREREREKFCFALVTSYVSSRLDSCAYGIYSHAM